MNAFDDPTAMTAIIITLPHREDALTKDECQNAGFEADQNCSGCTHTWSTSGSCCACAQTVQITCIAPTSFLSRCLATERDCEDTIFAKKKGGLLPKMTEFILSSLFFLTWCSENMFFRQTVVQGLGEKLTLIYRFYISFRFIMIHNKQQS
jgi:hypothetical protein